MRRKGWSALAVLLAAGCASIDPAQRPGTLTGISPKSGACGTRPVAREARADPAGPPSHPAPTLEDRPKPEEARPQGLAASPAPVVEEGPAPTPESEVKEPVAPEPVAPEPVAVEPPGAPSIEEAAPITPVEPEPVAPLAPPEVRVLPDALPAPSTVARPPAPPRPKGRPVASVGDELITLPELTEAVKARLAQVGTGKTPTNRQMMTLSRSVLKLMVVRSLVLQEAAEKLGGPAKLDEARARIGRTWLERDLPALLRDQKVASEAELRAKLAPSLATPESLREDSFVKALATEMMRADGAADDLETYLDGLRRRRPIEALMSPAELAVAGRQAALAEGVR